MNKHKGNLPTKPFDSKEFELPETVFIRDIENKVFQGIVLQSLASIEGITLLEGNIIDSILGRGSPEGIKGISAVQNSETHSIHVKMEVNICYGYSIPDKAEEIQTKIAEAIINLTGLPVACVHVVFKNVVPADAHKKLGDLLSKGGAVPVSPDAKFDDDYDEEF